MIDRSQMTRRQALGMAGAASAAAVAARLTPLGGDSATGVAEAQTPSCVLTPDKTEGPYFVEELNQNRSDIRSGQDGTAVTLNFTVVDVNSSCEAIRGAVVDIWHANAAGAYSDVQSEGTAGVEWLRGYQYTDANGKCAFTTIFPGWYQGRAVHIHFKVRVLNGATVTNEFTSQLFFDPSRTTAIYAGDDAYQSRSSTPDTANSEDGIYGSDGSRLVVPLTASGSGYSGSFVIGLSGGSSSSGNIVDASVKSLRWGRTKSGRRFLRVKFDVDERVTLGGRLTRRSKSVVYRRRRDVKAGLRRLDIPVPRRTRGGKAKLTLSITDAAGKVKRRTRSVRVPPRNL